MPNFKIGLPVFLATLLLAGCGSGSSSATTPGADTQAPSVPTGLTSSNIASSGATISWAASTDNVAVTGYQIYRDGAKIGSGAATTFADSGLTASTTYSYTVAAFDAAGNTSAQSAVLSVTTAASSSDTQAPSVPSGLAATGITANGATLSWSASTDNVAVTGYLIYRNGTQVGRVAATMFVDSGLAASTTYAYTVAAFDAAGNTSAQSAPLSVTTSAATSIINLVKSFDGVNASNGPVYKDHPDLGGAVGPNHVVDFDGATFTVRDKSTGNVLMQLTQSQFWSNAGVTPGQLNDPRLVYDPLAGRWYAVTAGPYAFIAISAGTDPTGQWKALALDTTNSGDLLVKVGFDATGIYACDYAPTSASNCYAIPKVDLLWGGQLPAPTLARMTMFGNLAFETVPALDLTAGKALTAPEIILTRQGGQTASNLPMVLTLYKVTWSGNCTALSDPSCQSTISAAQSISTSQTYTTPGNAVQPGNAPPIRANEDHRFFTVFVSGGSVFTSHGTEINGRVGFEWFEIRISDGSVLQQAQLADPNADLIFPSLAVDGSGNVGIGYTKTSVAEFPSVYLVGRLATDPPNTLRSPILATAGTSGYACSLTTPPVGWGTYTSTMQDPSNPLTLWTYQEYANSATDCQWATRWVAFSL